MLKIEIVKYEEGHIPAVKEFNRRLKEGGSHYRFPESHIPQYPHIEGRQIYQEYFLAMEEGVVRGGYMLKHHIFVIKGEERPLGSLELPVSEGSVNRKYHGVGTLLINDCLRRFPLLFVAGLGGFDQPVTKFLQKMRWSIYEVPFYFRINKPTGFLRNIRYLRRNRLNSIALDILAYSGFGWLGIKIHQAFISRKRNIKIKAEAELTGEFGDWSDKLWNARKGEIFFSSSKRSNALEILYPSNTKDTHILRISGVNGLVGWVVVKSTRLENHSYFDGMMLGTIIDCFSVPGGEHTVISEATSFLESQNVDLVVSNQSHRDWCRALSLTGYLRGPSNFLFAASGALAELLEPLEENVERLHINRGNSGYWNF